MSWLVISLAVAYGFVVILILLILLASEVPLILRVTAIMLGVPFIFVTYHMIGELRGLPSEGPLPKLFELHWSVIEEPDKAADTPGAIYLWLRPLNAQNYPTGEHRVYRLPYSSEVAETVRNANNQIENGQSVAGELMDDLDGLDTADRLSREAANAERRDGADAGVGERIRVPDFGTIKFGDMPSPVRPEKPL